MSRVTSTSFVRFVYPFLFDSDSFDRYAAGVDSAKCGSLGPLWERHDFPQEDVLHHVAQFLNPPDGVAPTARLWHVSSAALHSPQGLGNGAEWSFVRQKHEIPIAIEDVQLVLFRIGVGFLSLRVRPRTDSLDDWLDVLHYFRFLERHDVGLRVRRRVGLDDGQPKYEPYFPSLAADSGRGANDDRSTGDLVTGLLRTIASGPEPWWRDVFIAGQLLPYAVLAVDGSDEDQRSLLLYKAHNFFHSRQGNHPAPEELRTDQDHLVPYALRHWFVFSLDGAAFVGFDPPDEHFFRSTLPAHLDGQYFLLYVMTLHQRFALMSFAEDVSANWLPSPGTENADDRAAVFRRIRDRFLQFTARGAFAQVMQRRHHHRCYSKWQETFQIDRLFREVEQEVRDMHDYLQMRRTEHIEHLAEVGQRLDVRLNRMAALFVPPALALGFLDAAGGGSLLQVTLVTLVGLLIGVAMIALFSWNWNGDDGSNP